MSYHGTKCPCGGKKERDTMICSPCEQFLGSTQEFAAMNNQKLAMNNRRAAAIRVLSMSRKRHQLQRALTSATKGGQK